MIIRDSDYARLVFNLRMLVKESLSLFQEHPRWKGKTGTYFCFADAETGAPLFEPARIGQVLPEKTEKYLAVCKEKAKRLAAHPHHKSSWESRDPGVKQWGGAVRIGDFIFSITGLPEMGDEAVMLILAEIYNPLDPIVFGDATWITSKSNNPYWYQLRGHIRQLI